MNSKEAIKNVADVPSKFDKAGGTLSGEVQMNGKAIRLTTNNSGNARLGYDSSTNDVFISNYDNNWLRLKQDKTMTYAGYKVYTAFDKPTPADIGALASTGTAVAATKLATSRTINGTGFDGSANITTANWGTARTLTIGSTGKSVNGSANISWSLSEIGAAAASHSHDYLPLSGGTLTGSLLVGSNLAITGTVLVNNNQGYKGKDTSNVSRNLVAINSSNQVVVGDSNNQALIFSSATPKYCPSASIGYALYHEGNKPTPADIGAIASSKITISQTAPSNPSTGDLWISW